MEKLYTFWELDDKVVRETIAKRKTDPKIINKVSLTIAAKPIWMLTEEEFSLLDLGIPFKEKISFDEFIKSRLVVEYTIGGRFPHITLSKHQQLFQNIIDNILSVYSYVANGKIDDDMVYRDIHQDDTVLDKKRFLITGEEVNCFSV